MGIHDLSSTALRLLSPLATSGAQELMKRCDLFHQLDRANIAFSARSGIPLLRIVLTMTFMINISCGWRLALSLAAPLSGATSNCRPSLPSLVNAERHT